MDECCASKMIAHGLGTKSVQERYVGHDDAADCNALLRDVYYFRMRCVGQRAEILSSPKSFLAEYYGLATVTYCICHDKQAVNNG